VFDQECATFPGFRQTLNRSDGEIISYENFRHICHKWHFKVTKCFASLLDSKEYTMVRNAIIVLNHVRVAL
jgi:THO complex subunit 2